MKKVIYTSILALIITTADASEDKTYYNRYTHPSTSLAVTVEQRCINGYLYVIVANHDSIHIIQSFETTNNSNSVPAKCNK